MEMKQAIKVDVYDNVCVNKTYHVPQWRIHGISHSLSLPQRLHNATNRWRRHFPAAREVDKVEAEADNSFPCCSSKLSGQTMYHAFSNNGQHLYNMYLHYLTNSFSKQCATNSYILAYAVNYTFKVFLLLSVHFYCT